MITVDKHDAALPAWALSYLINNDDSGIDQEDKNLIDAWRKRQEERHPDCYFEVSPNDSEEHFTWSPEFGKACSVVDATLLWLYHGAKK